MQSVVVEVHGAMSPHELAAACARVESLLREEVPVRVHVPAAELGVIDALARMRLCARRLDALFEVTGSCADLVELVGLTEVLQVGRQAEAHEQRGVEEVVDVGDPPA